jgi:hypothetical protein
VVPSGCLAAEFLDHFTEQAVEPVGILQQVSTQTSPATRSPRRRAASTMTSPPIECPINTQLTKVQLLGHGHDILAEGGHGPGPAADARLAMAGEIDRHRLVPRRQGAYLAPGPGGVVIASTSSLTTTSSGMSSYEAFAW